MTDRTALADALHGSTAWELAEDARLVSLFRKHGTPIPADTLDRLAALALATAEMQERGEKSCNGVLPTWRVQPEGDAAWHIDSAQTTLPAALAQLLRGAP